MTIRTNSELSRLSEFIDRYNYLKLFGIVGRQTFGFDRYINQNFYTSREWRSVRDQVITRDRGCDLGVPGYEIHDRIYIHHMNPMTPEDIERENPDILNPEYLISVTHRTHNAIHFGDEKLLVTPFTPRRAGDTRMW